MFSDAAGDWLKLALQGSSNLSIHMEQTLQGDPCGRPHTQFGGETETEGELTRSPSVFFTRYGRWKLVTSTPITIAWTPVPSLEPSASGRLALARFVDNDGAISQIGAIQAFYSSSRL